MGRWRCRSPSGTSLSRRFGERLEVGLWADAMRRGAGRSDNSRRADGRSERLLCWRHAPPRREETEARTGPRAFPTRRQSGAIPPLQAARGAGAAACGGGATDTPGDPEGATQGTLRWQAAQAFLERSALPQPPANTCGLGGGCGFHRAGEAGPGALDRQTGRLVARLVVRRRGLQLLGGHGSGAVPCTPSRRAR